MSNVSLNFMLPGIRTLLTLNSDATFTKYKQLQNIDFSGVMPNFGVKIGIVK